MAFNWQTFRTRALTAIVFVVIMMAGLLYNRWSFFILFSIVHFGAWTEYQKLVGRFNPDYQKISAPHRYGIMVAGWCLMLFFTNDSLAIGSIILTQVGFWIGIAFMILLPVIMFWESKPDFSQKYFLFSFWLIVPIASAGFIDRPAHPMGRGVLSISHDHSFIDHFFLVDQRYHGLHRRVCYWQNTAVQNIT